jgi:mannose-1-phosphate guanylyltransferase
MNLVLLSGGSGKRLWPLSNDTNSKQFLKVLRDDNGERESMVQRIYRQLRQAIPKANVLISTNDSQLALVQKQISGKVDIVIEPSRRNTFPAIVLAAAFLKYRNNLSDDTPFVVLPIDAYAESEYFCCMGKMTGSTKNVTLMGVAPVYPSEKYGYILVKDDTVCGFKEKPSLHEAESLIRGGALWNCGVFAMKIGYIIDVAHRYIDFNSYDTILSQFDRLPANSFDYEILEREDSIGYVEYDGFWKDIGTWNTLTEELAENIDPFANIQMDDGCLNTHILNMLDKPIIVLGIPNSVIVASNDGVLVADKTASSQLKPYADKIVQRPMYEQRQWGNYRVLDYVRGANESTLTKRMRIDAGKSMSYHYHSKRREIWVFVSGEGIVTIDGVKQVVESGSVITVEIGSKHKISAATDIEFIEIQIGDADLEEADIAGEN